MESARVRGCVATTPREPARVNEASYRQADASRRRSGPRNPGDGGSRCDLEVSPASTGPPDAGRRGRRPVVAEKLRKPQQAAVGTKTRSAGRTPSSPGPGKAGGRSVQRVLPVIGG